MSCVLLADVLKVTVHFTIHLFIFCTCNFMSPGTFIYREKKCWVLLSFGVVDLMQLSEPNPEISWVLKLASKMQRDEVSVQSIQKSFSEDFTIFRVFWLLN